MDPSISHTLEIFSRLYRAIPPLVPEPLVRDMREAAEQLEHNYELTLDQVEDTLIIFGKALWPYRKAFHEFLTLYEGRVGEHFFLAHVPAALARRYREFQVHGGTLRDLHLGRPASFFSSDERQALCTAFIAMHQDLRSHAVQAVMSVDRNAYEARIEQFRDILSSIEERLNALREMANREQEHPALASEIRAQVRAFDYGLCALGPETTYLAVCNAPEHFVGRKVEKKMKV